MDYLPLGLAEWGLRERPRNDHPALIRRLGLTRLEVGIGTHARALPADVERGRHEVETLRWESEKARVTTPAAALDTDFCVRDWQELRERLERAERALQVASLCGCTVARIFAGLMPVAEVDEEIWRRLLYALGALTERAAALGIRLGVETQPAFASTLQGRLHLHTVTTQPHALERLVRGTPAALGFTFDPANLRPLSALPLVEYCHLLAERIVHAHLKEWTVNPDGSCLPAAVGDIPFDWTAVFEACDYDGVWYIEYEPTADQVAGVRRTLQYLRLIGARPDDAWASGSDVSFAAGGRGR